MSIARAIIILIFITLIQMSFVRLIIFFPVFPNLLLVVLFLINYFQPFANILVLSVTVGILADLFGAVNFGASAISLVIVGAAMYLLREKLLKGKTSSGFVISGVLVFPLFYLSLFIFNNSFNLIYSNNFIFSSNIAAIWLKEIPADFVLLLAAYFFTTNYYGLSSQGRFYKFKN